MAKVFLVPSSNLPSAPGGPLKPVISKNTLRPTMGTPFW
jgi:hypothetical protein